MEFKAVPGYQLDEIALAGEATKLLSQHYPGYLWAVHINSTPLGGICYILNFHVSDHIGYVLHLDHLYTDVNRNAVVRAGGEYLEAAGLPHRIPTDGSAIVPMWTNGDMVDGNK